MRICSQSKAQPLAKGRRPVTNLRQLSEQCYDASSGRRAYLYTIGLRRRFTTNFGSALESAADSDKLRALHRMLTDVEPPCVEHLVLDTSFWTSHSGHLILDIFASQSAIRVGHGVYANALI